MNPEYVYSEGTGLCVLLCNYKFDAGFMENLSKPGIKKDGRDMKRTMTMYGYEIHRKAIQWNLNLEKARLLFKEGNVT